MTAGVHLRSRSVIDLLKCHSALMDELRDRGVIRSANNPTGDFTEYLFCAAFSWSLEGNSKKGYDAVDANGQKYQIKGRRLHKRNKSRQLSAIRDLNGFNFLAAALFDDNYDVVRAAVIPASVVFRLSSPNPYTNSHKFLLTDDVWNNTGVKDVTTQLKKALARLK